MFSSNHQVLLDSHRQQESFYEDVNQDQEIGPQDLSGDQKTEPSLLLKDESNKANSVLSATTIIKTVIGSGILVMPYVVSKCGVVFALIVFVIASGLTQFSAVLLLKAKNLSGHSSYATILFHIFQKGRAKVGGLVWTAFGNFGVCIAEIIIFKQSVRKMLEDVLSHDDQSLKQFYTKEIFFALVFSIFLTPFLLTRKIQKLKFLALMGVNGIIVFIVAFVAHFIIVSVDEVPSDKPKGAMQAFPEDWLQAFAAIPSVIYGLVFMFNFFPIYKGMRRTNDKKMKMVSLSSILVCSCFYMTIGILGYNLVGQSVNGNFLESLPYVSTDSTIYFIINCSFLLSIYFSFPIMFFGSRNNFITLSDLLFTVIQNPQSESENTKSHYTEQNDRSINFRGKYGVMFMIKTWTVFLLIVGIGIWADDITVIYNAVGAICATSSGFLLPCGFYIMLVRKKKKEKRLPYYAAVSIFVCMVPFALFTIVANYLPQ